MSTVAAALAAPAAVGAAIGRSGADLAMAEVQSLEMESDSTSQVSLIQGYSPNRNDQSTMKMELVLVNGPGKSTRLKMLQN